MKSIANYESSLNVTVKNKFKFSFDNQRPPKLKIAYVSPDFRDHSLAHLFAKIPALHDRDEFEVYLHFLNKDDGSVFYKNIHESGNLSIDASNITESKLADSIFNLGIHIVINLYGLTNGSKTKFLAMKPAPINVLYLGVPLTMGIDFIDYFIGDHISTPIQNSNHFEEKLVSLPHSYFCSDYNSIHPHLLEQCICFEDGSNIGSERNAVINAMDLKSKIPNLKFSSTSSYIFLEDGEINQFATSTEEKFTLKNTNLEVLNGMSIQDEYLDQAKLRDVMIMTTRESYGLPNNVIVFCNFCQTSKYDPKTFASWIKIIQNVPHSVLWLISDNLNARRNIEKKATELGICKYITFIVLFLLNVIVYV